MEDDLEIAYAEVDKILEYIPIADLKKIPINLRKVIRKRKNKNYKVNINPKIPLENQNLQRKTYIILAILNLNYWTKEEEKEKIQNLYWQNGRRKQKELREKNDPYIILNRRNMTYKSETAVTAYKQEKFLEKIFSRIKMIFKKLNIKIKK